MKKGNISSYKEPTIEKEIIKTTEPFWRDDGDRRLIMVSSLIKVTNLNDLKIDPEESSAYRWIKTDDPIVRVSPGMKLSFEKLKIPHSPV